MVLLLLATPGLGRAAEDPAPPNAVPPAGEKPADVKMGLDLPAAGESEPETEGKKQEPRLLAVPFPFFNASIGAGLGVGLIGQGYLQQPQAGFVMAALVSSGSYLVYFKALNYQFPWFKRIILEPDFEVGKYHDVDTFTGTDNPGYPGERAGSNGSNENNFITSDTSDQWVNLVTRIVLPIGQGKDRVIPRIVLDRGGNLSPGTRAATRGIR